MTIQFLRDRTQPPRAEVTPRKGMPKAGEPLGFFGLLTAEQEQKIFAYRGEETVGDPAEMAALLEGKPPSDRG